MIIVDTREQNPIWNPDDPDVIRMKLEEGDYTTTELINKAHIERKSGQDLYGSIIQGHDRFKSELLRASSKGIRLAIFVECLENDFIYKKFPHGRDRKTPASQLDKIVNTMASKYNVDFIWCGNREKFKEYALLWFDRQREIVR